MNCLAHLRSSVELGVFIVCVDDLVWVICSMALRKYPLVTFKDCGVDMAGFDGVLVGLSTSAFRVS